MRNLLQPGVFSSQKPLWLRWITVLSILLIAVMATARSATRTTCRPSRLARIGALPGRTTARSASAMHSALPATLQATPEPFLHLQTLDSTAADAERLFRWRFQLASRPPPSDSAAAPRA